jgi:hypothetical protein
MEPSEPTGVLLAAFDHAPRILEFSKPSVFPIIVGGKPR